jgi:hypothetical protein
MAGGRWQISTGGGTAPRWRQDGTDLFYIAADRTLTAAPVRAADASFESSTPKRLFPIASVSGYIDRDEYAVSADGSRFLVSRPTGDAANSPVTVVVNWRASLKR